jgi:type I restriction enzyme S subunit
MGGGTPSKQNHNFWGGNIPWASVKDLSGDKLSCTIDKITVAGLENSSSNLVPAGNIIVCTRIGLGKIVINEIDVAINQDLRAIFLSKDTVLKEYFIYFYKSIDIKGSGTTVKGISLEELHSLLFPLPPFGEQCRIVECLDRLLHMVTKLEVDEIKLDGLQKSFPYKMKRAILQCAFQGKLVPQDPNDEPASVLLERIRAEREKLIKAGKIKRGKTDSIITRSRDNCYYEKFADGRVKCVDDEVPFDLPESWCWVRLGSISYNHGQKKPDEEFTYIDISSINNELNTLGDLTNVLKPKDAPSRARKIVCKGDVIYATVRPYLHNICLIDREITPKPIVSTGFAVVCTPEPLLNKYLFYCFLSSMFDSYANDMDNAKGVAYPAINDDKFSKALIPLPPLGEQCRIVECLADLLTKIDKLDAD